MQVSVSSKCIVATHSHRYLKGIESSTKGEGIDISEYVCYKRNHLIESKVFLFLKEIVARKQKIKDKINSKQDVLLLVNNYV